ncbi:MAG: protein kinase, partial [Phycisphaerales bacterium]
VKVIDFGVAKAISQRLTEKTIYTELGQLIGTPEYMSPEQAEMNEFNIDTRTDIYSLGVLLYELLVGALPFDPTKLRQAAFAEIQRIIREEEPSKPSTRLSSLDDSSTAYAHKRRADPRSLLRELRGDLDWIVMKAIEKDRTRRYATASELVAEIRRHLHNEPVVAGPPSVLYRVRKFARRNKVIFTAMSVVSLVLVASTLVSLVFAIQANHAKRQAEWNSYIATVAAANAAHLVDDTSELKRQLDTAPQQHRGWEWEHLWSIADASLLTIRYGDEIVNGLAFSPDGSRVFGVSGREIKSWDAATGARLTRNHAPADFAQSVVFSPNSQYVAYGSGRNIRIWAVAPVWKHIGELPGHLGTVYTFAFSQRSETLATAAEDGTIRLWNVDEQKELRSWSIPNSVSPGSKNTAFALA